MICIQATGKSGEVAESRFIMDARKSTESGSEGVIQASFSSGDGMTVRQSGDSGKIVMDETSLEEREFFDLIPFTAFETATASPADV